MKEKLTNNLAIKLIALFCAFFVWLAVVNVANPIKVSTREVPVTITNDQVLEQADPSAQYADTPMECGRQKNGGDQFQDPDEG